MSSNELDGMHYDRGMRMYVPDVVSETADPFTLITPPERIEGASLPTSPKGVWKAALGAGWNVSCWRSEGVMAPTLYIHASEEGDENPHSAGDVLYDGYALTIYVVEAREPYLPLAFQAFYHAKTYGPGDKRNTLGSFEFARVLDPVGIPVELRADYKPIKVSRGTDSKGRVTETAESFRRNQMRAERAAEAANREYNDGSYWMWNSLSFHAAKPLTAWIGQWASFGPLSHETDREAA